MTTAIASPLGLIESPTKDGSAVSFYFEGDFVTEFYNRHEELIGFWTADAVFKDDGKLDESSLRAFHEVNVLLYDEDGGGPLE